MLTRGVLYLAVLLSGLMAGAQLVETNTAPDTPLNSANGPYTCRRGPFTVHAPSRTKAYAGLDWAEASLTDLTRITGLAIPNTNREFHVFLASTKTNGLGRVLSTNSSSTAQFIQTLNVVVAPDSPSSEANHELRRQILHAMAWRENLPSNALSAFAAANAVPPWLIDGLSRNVDILTRNADAAVCVGLWQSGRLPSFSSAFRSPTAEPLPTRPELTGFFVNWLLSQTNHTSILEDVFDGVRHAQSPTISWVASHIVGSTNAPLIEDAWDIWVERQRRVVYHPGIASQVAIDQLKSYLAIYAGINGVPWTSDNHSRLSFLEIATQHRELWVQTLCDDKCACLRFISIGQGDRFRQTVESYCNVFQAIKVGAGRRTLQRLIHKAEASLMELDGLPNESVIPGQRSPPSDSSDVTQRSSP